MAFQHSTKDNPFVQKYIWRVSNGGRVCELCLSRDGHEFDKNDIALDHPNGMCVLVPKISKSYDEIAEELADFVSGKENESLNVFRDNLRINTELACAKGGICFKPYISGDKIVIDCVHQGQFYPTSYDGNRKITGAIFISQKTENDVVYTRLEHHELKGDIYTITNTAYKSHSSTVLGERIPLSAVAEWSDISPQLVLSGISEPLFSCFKIPIANNADYSSPLGVSVYARAVETFRELDEQYSRYLWEFEGGTLAIHASADLLKMNAKTSKIELPKGHERLYRAVTTANVEDNFFEVFSPAFRDVSLLSGFNALLRLIESECGLAFGTISDVQQVDKTATETIQAKQEYYSTVVDIQKSLESAIRQLVYIIDVWCDLCKLCPSGNLDSLSFYWDDSIVVDKEAKKQQFWQYVTAGKFPAWKFF